MEYLGAPATVVCAPRRRRTRAFTLIELLVVVLIMGVLAGLVTMTVRPGDRAVLATEAQRLARLLELAAAQAQAAGMPLRWSAGVTGYQFAAYRAEAGWAPPDGGEVWRARSWPPGIAVTRVAIEDAPRRAPLALYFYPGAPPVLFSIELTLGAERMRVAMSPLGTVRALAVGEAVDDAPSRP